MIWDRMTSTLETIEDPGELTSFGPPNDENTANSSSVFQFMANLFIAKKELAGFRNVQEINGSDASSCPSVLDLQSSGHVAVPVSQKKLARPMPPHNPGSEVEFRLRSLSAILKDLPKLVKGSQSSQDEQIEGSVMPVEDSSSVGVNELRQYWMPDEQCHECYDCGEKFTTFRRRHHCRICGQIFCSRCCNQLISGEIMGLSGMLRSCTYCCKLVVMFAEGNPPKSVVNYFTQASSAANIDSTMMEDSAVDGSVLVQNEAISFSNNHHPLLISSQSMVQSQSNTSLRRTSQTSVAMRHEIPVGENGIFTKGPFENLNSRSMLSPAKDVSGWKSPVYIFDATPGAATPSLLENGDKDNLVQDSTQLHSLWRKIVDEKLGIEFRGHRFRLRKYSNCITGQELIDWLIRSDLASTRTQGCAIGQALYEGKWLKPVVDGCAVFQDGYVLFQSGKKHSNNTRGSHIEIYPDHFANFPDENEGETLRTMTEREPIWVQEIKCGDEPDVMQYDEVDGYCDDASQSELTWSDDTNNFNETFQYSDENRSLSEKSVVSYSSFVEIDEENDIIKYTRTSSLDKFRIVDQQHSSYIIQPIYDDSSLTSVSADYLRNFIVWNGTYLGQPWIPPSSGWRENDLQSMYLDSHDKRAFQWLQEVNLRHNLTFLRQLLRNKGLDLAWADVLVPLAKYAAEHIALNPSINTDVCHYFHIKKVTDGPKLESHILNGVVCTKNVVHKQMKTYISEPAILLLAIPLEYQRVQLKLTALDPIVRQEKEFYKHLISRITARNPQIVLVQCSVSHLAQDLLLQAGITLVINVKSSVMERLARITEADIVYSIDQLFQAKLGHCSRFYTKHHQVVTSHFQNGKICSRPTTKTLMYFDGCNPIFGCTAILRETTDILSATTTSQQLFDVQEVLRFIVRAMFHARLELSYLIDQHNFGKLLKKHTKQSRRFRSESESTAENFEMEGQNTTTEQHANEPKTFKSGTEDLNMSNLRPGSENSLQQDNSHYPLQAKPMTPDGVVTVDHLMFKDALKSNLLTISPLIRPRLPFIFTPQSEKSIITKFLPKKLFWSRNFEVKSSEIKNKLSSVTNIEQREEVRRRSSTMDSLDRLWCTAPHRLNKSLSAEPGDLRASVDTLDNNHCSKEILLDATLISPVQIEDRFGAHCSCYTRQYQQQKNEAPKNIGDESTQVLGNTRLHSWEQNLLDVVFGPPIDLHSEKQDKFVLSTEYSPNKNRNFKWRHHFTATDGAKFGHDATVVLGKNVTYSHVNSGPHHLHAFITFPLTQPASSENIEDLLASYRACVGIPNLEESQPRQLLHGGKKTDHDENTFPDQVEGVKIDFPSVSSNKHLGPDCMDPVSHQHICALFSSHSPQSPNAPYHCVLPWVIDIDFYRGNDITLGGFLERYCFRPSYLCPNATCRRPMVEHVRSFAHGNVCMTVSLKELSKPFQQLSILTWNWNHVTGKSSDIRTLSRDAWSMSFAKYLELNLEQLTIPEVRSSQYFQKGFLTHDILGEEWELRPFTSFQYFLFRDIVAAFKCFPISIYEVNFPDFVLHEVNDDSAVFCQLSDDFNGGALTYGKLCTAVESLGEKVMETIEAIQECIQTSRARKMVTENSTEELLLSREKFYFDMDSSFAEDKEHLLNELSFVKILTKSNLSQSSAAQNFHTFDAWGENGSDFEDPLPSGDLASDICTKMLSVKCEICKLVQTWNEKLAEAHEKDLSSYWTSGKIKMTGSPQFHRKQKTDSSIKAVESALEHHDTKADTELNYSPPRLRSRIHSEVLADERGAAIVHSLEPQSHECDEIRNYKSSGKIKISPLNGGRGMEKTLSSRRLARTGSSVKLLVTRLLPGNSLIPCVPMPFLADEHFLLPECLSTNIVVRDAEPTSSIAYALSSKKYIAAMAELTSPASSGIETSKSNLDPMNKQECKELTKTCDDQPVQHETGRCQLDTVQEIIAVVPGSGTNAQDEFENSQDESVISFSSSDQLQLKSPHIELQFSDTTTRFYCKVYFAELFENFRSKVLEGGDKQYLSSLSRSVKWLARGGKSGSTFYKTKDDQFILKQMSYFELQSFLDFAPKYVNYVAACIENQEATTISKILGVYRISFRNSETSRSLKQDVLVIENLFYKKKVARVFDLKGSVRNRHVKASATKEMPDIGQRSDQTDIVLQDENLLMEMCENPIYVHEHTKYLLMSAISRDTEFLSRNLVMDYSLLVGIQENEQITVGIIDFIRTFTWDKKLEMVVKWSSSRSMPTVVSPELYKNRYFEAMDRYFQVVPDRWYGMNTYSSKVDEETEHGK